MASRLIPLLIGGYIVLKSSISIQKIVPSDSNHASLHTSIYSLNPDYQARQIIPLTYPHVHPYHSIGFHIQIE